MISNKYKKLSFLNIKDNIIKMIPPNNICNIKITKSLYFNNCIKYITIPMSIEIIKEGKIVKIEDIESLEDTNIIKVKIEAEEIEKLEKELEIEQVITKQENKIEFLYSKEINSLIEKISKYKISKLLIQEIDMEEIFMHYYK